MLLIPPDEYPQYTAGYVARVGDRDPRELLAAQVSFLEKAVSGLDEEAELLSYAPGKWSVREVIGHLTDSERVFSYRLLRIARGDATPLPGFDQNLYVEAAGFDQRPLADLVAEFRVVRAATLSVVTTIPDAALVLDGAVSGFRITVRALLSIIPGHVAHHFDVLADRYGLDGFRE